MKICTTLVEFSVSQAFLMLMYVADKSLSSILTCSDCLPRAQALTKPHPKEKRLHSGKDRCNIAFALGVQTAPCWPSYYNYFDNTHCAYIHWVSLLLWHEAKLLVLPLYCNTTARLPCIQLHLRLKDWLLFCDAISIPTLFSRKDKNKACKYADLFTEMYALLHSEPVLYGTITSDEWLNVLPYLWMTLIHASP